MDLDARHVTVAITRVVAERVEVGEPKTRAGARVVSLDAETAVALTSWHRRQLEERMAAGPAWVEGDYVFTDERGVAPHPETVTRWWREAVAGAGLRPIRLHDARHTAATVMLRAASRSRW